ncbi:peptide-methionine (S)-S-oxide reductase [Acinetobacter junii]|uniref:peptide-methionine (S)-S-oxide reductase n=1 Tax=Acinetobacter junii TaxID=40215 RepID=UPI001F18836D|nr:peptide-methionine (S)-S-oxide reductase [Acinetobacter junii]
MKLDYVIVAGGCFWGLEDLLRNQDGVTSTKVCSGTEMATAQDVKMSCLIATDYQAEPA